MQGRVCIVTGATNGIGEATALELARMGATVVIVGRNETKAKATIAKIKEAVPSAKVEYLLADLSLMRDIKKLAQAFLSKYDRLDVLVNNAGMVFDKRTLTAEGLEITFALNHMSYFYLTNLLLDTLKASGTPTQKSRVVSVSSGAHQLGKPNFDDLQFEHGYSQFRSYGQSKMMNIMFTNELSRRLASENANVTANSLHPGAVRTGFGADSTGIMRTLISLVRPFFLTPEKGAQTSIYLASSPEVEGVSGKYFAKSKPAKTSKNADVQSDWTRLWAYSEETLQKLALDV
ncbi:MAG: SDR family oxidoreductase [bacterium]|nr:SDR family oxidoreductase [bacterium]